MYLPFRQSIQSLQEFKKVLDFFRAIRYNNQWIWLYGQAVKTPPSHGGYSGSNPDRVTTLIKGRSVHLPFFIPKKGDVMKMVKHIILWKLKDMPETEKAKKVQKIKEGLEGLAGKIPGMTDIHVIIDKLATSTADAMLDSTFESAEALKVYSSHPDHVAVADTFIRPYIEIRSCIDYEI